MAAEPAADVRREQILRAAAMVIGERGFGDDPDLRRGRQGGGEHRLVIYYFRTRDRLLIEALRYSEDCFYAEISNRLGGLASPAERLEHLVRLSCEPRGMDGLPGSWVLWLELWSQAVRHPDAARDREELDGRWRGTIADIVRDGQASGAVPDRRGSRASRCCCARVLDGLARARSPSEIPWSPRPRLLPGDGSLPPAPRPRLA
jgi:AcrR family transcriptional regulator